MYSDQTKSLIQPILTNIRQSGLEKTEQIITSPQSAEITVKPNEHMINLCANNYLGLANHPELIAAAKEGVEKYGFGMSSVRFICGTQDIHTELETRISEFLKTEATILYGSCFDANGGLFETVLDEECAIISDQLNHASIIDGIRLCKAKRYRYVHSDMNQLEEILQETASAKIRMIATDGVFSMDGDVAKLDQICDLAEKYDALVMVDDSHATGIIGETGRGSIEYCGVMGRVDIITSTLGKALGGASGGFTTGQKDIIDLLRQQSRPYIFSNTVAPVIVYTTLYVLNMIDKTAILRNQLTENTLYFREEMTQRGFTIKPGTLPIVPVILGDAKLAFDFAKDMFTEGIYVVGVGYPVVPKGQARIRVQISAAHTRQQLDQAIAAFSKVGKKYGVI